MDRRDFLRAAGVAAGAAAFGGVLAACGGSGDGGADAATAGTTATQGRKRKVRLGFIALTDCASIVMADHLGYFDERGLDVEILKQASWPATRDALLNGQIDGAHCLFGMPLSVATGIGGGGGTALKIAMMLNNNGQAITLHRDLSDAGYGDLDAARDALDRRDGTTLAMTFPGGTHDTWLRYWIHATRADRSKLTIKPVPPPQMVQNMSVGNMDGYCVGEPWNAVAVKQDIGFTHLATQDLWLHHPEKSLVVNSTFASEQTDTLRGVMGAILQASRWLDDFDNRGKAAEVIGVQAYVNAPAADIAGRLAGRYDLGAGLGTRTYEGNQMTFFRDGLVNFPRRAHAIWYLAQYQRFGLLREAPPYQQIVDDVLLTDLYAEVAAAEGVDVPDDDMSPIEVRLDGVTFDPRNPAEEAKRP